MQIKEVESVGPLFGVKKKNFLFSDVIQCSILQHSIGNVKMDEKIAQIEKLNDDCLESIADYLPQKDMFAFTLVSKRFNYIADRSIQSKLPNRRVTIRTLSPPALRKFGWWIQDLFVDFTADEKTVEVVCALCPNLKRLGFDSILMEAFSKSGFCKTLSQLEESQINRLGALRNFEVNRTSVEKALRGCKKLTKLTLAINGWTNIKPIYSVQFPKLREMEILLDGDKSSSSSPLMDYLQSNTTLTSLIVRSSKYYTDNISGYRQLSFIVVNLWRVQNLREITISITVNSTKPVVKSLFAMFAHLEMLTSFNLNVKSTDTCGRVWEDFSDMDLLKVKNLPNLTVFKFSHFNTSNITLPGVLAAIRNCPKLNWFFISGFRAASGPYILTNNDIFEKFHQIHNQAIDLNGEIGPNFKTEEDETGKCYRFVNNCENHINLYRRLLK